MVDGIHSIIPSIGTWACAATAFVVALTVSNLVVWLLNKSKHTARFFLGKI